MAHIDGEAGNYNTRLGFRSPWNAKNALGSAWDGVN